MATKVNSIISRLRRIARKLKTQHNALAIGIGLAYSERRNRWSGKSRSGKAPHWTKWTIKVLVKKKYFPRNSNDHFPQYVWLLVGKRRQKFRVDVVEVGKRWPKPRLLEIQANKNNSKVSHSSPVPGGRIAVRTCPNKLPKVNIVNSLPDGCRQTIGTVGWIGQNNKKEPYLITAAHVLDRVYPPVASGSLLRGKQIALIFDQEGSGFQFPSSQPPFVVPPSILLPGGWVVDVAGLQLPYPPHFSKIVRVPDAVDLRRFIGGPAVIRVGRKPRSLPGFIETVLDPFTYPFDGVLTRLPPLIVLRFRDDRTTVVGDSGAPVLARRNNRLYLLGFHFAEIDKKAGEKDFRTASFSIPAHSAFRFLKLKPYVGDN